MNQIISLKMEFLIYLNCHLLLQQCVSKVPMGKTFCLQKMAPTSDFGDNYELLFFFFLLTRTEDFHDSTEVAWYISLHLYNHRNFGSLTTFQIKFYECQQLT